MDSLVEGDALRDLNAFIGALTDHGRILAGGAGYEAWASGLQDLCLSHRNVLASGGLLVPQLGEDAGFPQPFHRAAESLDFSIDRNAFDAELESLWQSGTVEARTIRIGSTQEGEEAVCLFSPVSYGFDRPIGYFWVVVADSGAELAQSVLHYASVLTSICVRAEKACHALGTLSRPVWKDSGLGSSRDLARYAAEICQEALCCHAAIVWFVDKKEKLLRTAGTSGQGCDRLKVDMDLGEGIAGACATENTVRVEDDLENKKGVMHRRVVQEKLLRSGIFVPLDAGGEVLGVLAAYASRPNAFSGLDTSIVLSVAQWLTTCLVQQAMAEETLKRKRMIDAEMPLIEAGTLAMARVHDAKNLLMFAQNELSKITTRIHKSQRKSATYIDAMSASRHIKRVNELISALVRRSKLTKKNLKPQSLVQIIRGVVNEAKDRLEEVRAEVEFDPPEDCIVKCDRDLLSRVFTNLLDNSLHFLSKIAGRRKIRITMTPSEGDVGVTFWDNGPGIPQDDIKNVFDVFFTTKGDRGMGFGLAIVKRIIEEHGGSVSVSSSWSHFAEFRITLPKN